MLLPRPKVLFQHAAATAFRYKSLSYGLTKLMSLAAPLRFCNSTANISLSFCKVPSGGVAQVRGYPFMVPSEHW